MGKQWKEWEPSYFGAAKSLQTETAAKIKRHLLLERKAMTNLDSVLESRDITLPTKVCLSSQSYGFSSSHGKMWELYHKEGWALKNWCFRIVVLEKTLESPLESKEIKSVNPLGNQPRIFIGRTDSEAEAPILWPHDANNRLFGKDWCWEGLTAGEEGRDKGWDGWMASLTQWTWVWANSGRWWRTGKPGLLQYTGSQRVRHDLANEQQ